MLKVMLVDDEPWVLEGLRTMVNWKKFGFEICGEALNGPDALRLIQEQKPDLVLTDINMPVFNGLELIAKLNVSMAMPPKFVILSGYDDFQYARTALRQRVDQYLLKPVDDEEIESLLGKMQMIIQNEIASNVDRQKKRAFIVNNLITRLIQGEHSEELRVMAVNLLNLQPDTELVCILIAPPYTAADIDQRQNDYFPWESTCFFQDAAGRSGMMIQSASISCDSLAENARRLQKALAEQLLEPAAIMISDRMTGIESMREIYLQTLEVWKLKYHREKGGVFFYSDLKRMSAGTELQNDSLERLLEKVKVNDTAGFEPGIRELFASFAEQLLTVEAVQAQVAHLEMTLCRLLAEMNGDPAILMNELQKEYGELGSLGDYFMLGKYADGLCRQTAVYLAELHSANEGNTIFNVIQYVDLEFRNKLQLQELARQFHMNSAYLGQLFRKETGRSFSEYLNEKRIEAAKGLLKRTQLKISDIALQVGFSNTDYFIDKFKLIVGVVPSVYKKANKNKQL